MMRLKLNNIVKYGIFLIGQKNVKNILNQSSELPREEPVVSEQQNFGSSESTDVLIAPDTARKTTPLESPFDQHGPEGLQTTNSMDHMYDALRYGVMTRPRSSIWDYNPVNQRTGFQIADPNFGY